MGMSGWLSMTARCKAHEVSKLVRLLPIGLFGVAIFQGFVSALPCLLLFPTHVSALVFGLHEIIKLALYG